MALARPLVILTAAVTGGLASSQLPEFAQQYRQRLGGALDEIRQVVEDFDADAARSNLARDQALDSYGRSAEPFLRDRGVSMTGVVRRYERLAEQKARLELARPVFRPLVVMRRPDDRVARGVWTDFEPAVPLNATGVVWAAIGAFAVGALAWVLALPFRRRRSPHRPAHRSPGV